MIPQHTMRPSVVRVSERLGPRFEARKHFRRIFATVEWAYLLYLGIKFNLNANSNFVDLNQTVKYKRVIAQVHVHIVAKSRQFQPQNMSKIVCRSARQQNHFYLSTFWSWNCQLCVTCTVAHSCFHWVGKLAAIPDHCSIYQERIIIIIIISEHLWQSFFIHQHS